jgi:photosystem II stability/assembly factor-like uncharacterized protein
MNMKRILLGLILLTYAITASAQTMYRPSAAEITTLPAWAQAMYSEDPSLWQVDSLFQGYYRTHPFVKTYHTQYFKRWRRKVLPYAKADGRIAMPTPDEQRAIDVAYQAKQVEQRGGGWTLVGPVQVLDNTGDPGKRQSNIYSLDQCAASPDIMYCGSETGEVYRSNDGGASWSNVSYQMNFGGGVMAVEVHPTNSSTVFAGASSLYRSTDGGQNWSSVLSNVSVNEVLINPGNTQIVLVASDNGLYRSTDGGANFTQLFPQRSYDVKCKPGTPGTMYLLKNNPTSIKCEFLRSTDFGATWTVQSTGWYNSTDPARNDGGGRLAVTPADPQRVYAYLIGEAKANDYGFIGIYRSNDGGSTWSLPNAPAGGPYTDDHANLAIGWVGWDYHQGYYNCAIMASNIDADNILVGGLNLYRSTDGGATFTSVAGYVGGPLDMHVDNQDFRAFGGEYWISTDGGHYRSTDFFTTQPEFRMYGVSSADYWGFGSGWNDDVLVGGMYHNGNNVYHENYGLGNHLELGGGEAPTGYVNPGDARTTYFSDIGGKRIPTTITGAITNAPFGMSPNESYWGAESSEMEFHPNCYNIAFIGNENKMWKTSDGGATFNLVYTFGSNTADQIKYIEVSSNDPQVIYCNQQPSSGNVGTLWKSTNGGQTWTALTIPSGNSRRMLLTLDPVDHQNIWIAYPGGSNGNKIFHSTNGGQSWTNITTSVLNGEEAHSILHITGTNGGVYYCTDRSVYYRNTAMGNWQVTNAGLPTYFNTNIARPFYRDGKIRIASYGKGIWENQLYEQPNGPIARITVDKLRLDRSCDNEAFYFDCYSFLNHQNATWQWTFPGGSPASSTLRNPAVTYTAPGTYTVTLTVTDANGMQDTDQITVQVAEVPIPTEVSEDFQSTFMPFGWWTVNADNGGSWEQNDDCGGFGNSTQSAVFRNFDIDSQGTWDELRFQLNNVGNPSPILTFDVAYSYYGGQYNDSLEVLVSTDCGANLTSVYLKGGNVLSTAPNSQEYFTPTSDQWRNEAIDLSAYSGQSSVLVAFRNRGRWGNNIYVDNINLSSPVATSAIAQAPQLTLWPNPVAMGSTINLSVPVQGRALLTDVGGKRILDLSVNGSVIQLPTAVAAGTYVLTIITSDTIWNRKVVVQ